MLPPILVLTRGDSPNRFAGYLAELLRMEGLNWCALRDVDSDPLRSDEPRPPLVVAGAVTLDESTAAHLAAHIRTGGTLLACRPGAALTTALDLPPAVPLPPDWSSRYVLLDAASPVTASLPWVETGVQYLGAAVALLPARPDGGYASPGPAAWLGAFPGQPSPHPAVLAGTLGAGRYVLFAFDPAESAVRQHQGRAEQASTGAYPDFDGDGTFRPNDLFLGQLDVALRDVPQADLQRTLLVRAVEWLTEDQPLPRLWRFPSGAGAAALIDGDSDNMAIEDFRHALDVCDRYGAPFATFLKPEGIEILDAPEHHAARERGHRFGPHPWAGPKPSPAELRDALDANCAAFAARYGYRPRIHRGHWIVWPGWVDHARSLAAAGIELDGNFTGGWGFKGGYVNGTGLPARFVDEDGRLLDVYEQSTISGDDSWLLSKAGLPAMTLAQAIARSSDQIDAAVDRYHTVVHPYFHPRPLKGGGAIPYPTRPWLESILAHCRRRGVPFLDAERWLDWNAARQSVRLEALRYDADGSALDFTLHAAATLETATVLIPLPAHRGQPEIRLDGAPLSPDGGATVVRHGRTYAAATLSLGRDDTRRVEVRWSS